MRLFIGLCEYTVNVMFLYLPQNNDGMQYVNSSQPVVYIPPGEEIWKF